MGLVGRTLTAFPKTGHREVCCCPQLNSVLATSAKCKSNFFSAKPKKQTTTELLMVCDVLQDPSGVHTAMCDGAVPNQ